MERVMGIEPTCSAWKADILPLNYTRIVLNSMLDYYITKTRDCQLVCVDTLLSLSVERWERKTTRYSRGSGWGVGDWIDASKKRTPATPWINKLVSQASQVEEKCFRS